MCSMFIPLFFPQAIMAICLPFSNVFLKAYTTRLKNTKENVLQKIYRHTNNPYELIFLQLYSMKYLFLFRWNCEWQTIIMPYICMYFQKNTHKRMLVMLYKHHRFYFKVVQHLCGVFSSFERPTKVPRSSILCGVEGKQKHHSKTFFLIYYFVVYSHSEKPNTTHITYICSQDEERKIFNLIPCGIKNLKWKV